MISRRKAIVAGIAGLVVAATPALAAKKNSTLVGQFDTDNDGTVDLGEAKKAAMDLFDHLDIDHDGTLDLKELHGRMSRGIRRRRSRQGQHPDQGRVSRGGRTALQGRRRRS